MKLTSVFALNAVLTKYNHLNSDHVEIVNLAVSAGYAVKLSTTQVQWTESGLEKAKAELPEFVSGDGMEIGAKVTRINSGNDSGYTGHVVELNPAANRARVLWGHSGIRTWVNFKFLSVNR